MFNPKYEVLPLGKFWVVRIKWLFFTSFLQKNGYYTYSKQYIEFCFFDTKEYAEESLNFYKNYKDL